MLYSHNGRTPKELPNRITLPNGRTRTDKSTFTKAELRDAGYYPALPKPDGDFEWTGRWTPTVYTPAELVAIEEGWVAAELSTADVEVIKHDDGHGRKRGTQPQWRKYRNDLRDRVIGGVIQGDPSNAGRPVQPI